MPPETPHVPQKNNSLGIPIAIVLSAVLIAAAIVYTGQSRNVTVTDTNKNNPTEEVTAEKVVPPMGENEHIRGFSEAPIVIIEYSDYDCPFCKSYHETMNKIIAEFGPEKKVAWVYRHLPLEQLHPNAKKIAEASECVAELGGNEAFWKFSDLVFGERGRNEPTDMNKLSTFAVNSGVDEKLFTACYESGRHTARIEDAIKSGFDAGARGTPYSVIKVGDTTQAIPGAQEYTVVRQMILSLLKQIEGSPEQQQ